jgi:hypothetical protein
MLVPFERDLRLEFANFFSLVIDDLRSLAEHFVQVTLSIA